MLFSRHGEFNVLQSFQVQITVLFCLFLDSLSLEKKKKQTNTQAQFHPGSCYSYFIQKLSKAPASSANCDPIRT